MRGGSAGKEIIMKDFLQMPRQQAVEELMWGIRQGLTLEQYEKLKAGLIAMPDYTFAQLLAEAKNMAAQRAITPKQYADALLGLGSANGVNSKNAALNGIPADFLCPERRDAIWKDICRTKASDRICLKKDDDIAICDLWQKSCSLPMGSIPSDLFFAGKIPLMDCEIVVDETEDPDGLVCEYRVVVYPDYRDRIREADGCAVDVAAVVFKLKTYTFFMPIRVCEGVDVLMSGPLGYHDVPDELLELCKKEWTQMDAVKMGYQFLITWYGIQVALLHPTVKDVFRNPTTVPVYTSGSRQGKGRRVVRYIRKHVINAEGLRAASCTGREYERHTLVWYVIGHWRNYGSGKRVFIQPYWKGALRNLKMSLDGRDREIVR